MTRMVAGTIAAHIGRRSELGASYGMNFRRCLIRADEAWHDRAHHTAVVRASAELGLLSAEERACPPQHARRPPGIQRTEPASGATALEADALHTRDTVSRQTSGVEVSTADVAKSTASHPTQHRLLHEPPAPSASTTSNTDATGPKCSSTAAPTSRAPRPGSTSPARRSRTSPAGANTAARLHSWSRERVGCTARHARLGDGTSVGSRRAHACFRPGKRASARPRRCARADRPQQASRRRLPRRSQPSEKSSARRGRGGRSPSVE